MDSSFCTYKNTVLLSTLMLLVLLPFTLQMLHFLSCCFGQPDSNLASPDTDYSSCPYCEIVPQNVPIFPHPVLSPFLITCPYHLSLPLLMKVVIGSTPTSLLSYSFVLLSFNEIPHIHLIICIFALSNFNPTSTSKGLVSLP